MAQTTAKKLEVRGPVPTAPPDGIEKWRYEEAKPRYGKVEMPGTGFPNRHGFHMWTIEQERAGGASHSPTTWEAVSDFKNAQFSYIDDMRVADERAKAKLAVADAKTSSDSRFMSGMKNAGIMLMLALAIGGLGYLFLKPK